MLIYTHDADEPILEGIGGSPDLKRGRETMNRNEIEITQKYNAMVEANRVMDYRNPMTDDERSIKSQYRKIMDAVYDVVGSDYETNETVLEIDGIRFMLCRDYSKHSVEHLIEVK